MISSSRPQAGGLRAPEPLTADHDFEAFDCGEPTLDRWLRQRALKNQASGASRTYVLCQDQRVIGFYCLAAGHIVDIDASPRLRRNMPTRIPMMVLGRFAIDRASQGQGLGRALLRDAVLRTGQASAIAGIRGILVHALSENAKQFYLRCGFVLSATEPMTLMATLGDVQAVLGDAP